MDNNFIEEYLIAIGAKTDSQSFADAKRKTSDLESSLKKIEKNTAFTALLQGIETFVKAANFAVSAIKKIGTTLYENIVGVARADMQYMKLARSMWVTKETAKGLQMAMDEMGASMDDIAWIPELREQFFRLREEINQFSTPADADNQLKYIRSIGYDIQALFVRLKMLREWVVYYLIKYMKPFLDEFKEFIKWISDQLGGNMAQAAKKFAAVLGSIVGSVYSLFKLLSKIVPPVLEWVQALPENVKKWGAVFAAVGAAIMAGPFGIFLAAIGAAFVLLQDFVYYMNGWSSSNTLAPVWSALVKFARGEGSQQVKRFENFLKTVANLLDTIYKTVRKLIGELDKSHPKLKQFGKLLLESIKLPFQQLRAFGDLFQLILKSLDLWLQGKRTEALKELASGFAKIDFTPEVVKNAVKFGKELGREFSWNGKPFGLKTQGANIDEQVRNLKPKWQEALPAVGGILNEAGMGDSEISSGARSYEHQMEINPSAPNSWHVDHGDGGDAVDIVLPDDVTYDRAMQIKKHFEDSGAFEEVLFHDVGSGYHLHLGGYKEGTLKPPQETVTTDNVGENKRAFSDMPAKNGFVSGENEMATAPFKDILDVFKPQNRSEIEDKTILTQTEEEPKKIAFDVPKASEYSGSYADVATSGFMAGENEMATAVLPDLPDFGSSNTTNNSMSIGDIIIKGINIGGTNAAPKDIAQAVHDGVLGAINARYQRGFNT